MAPAYFPLRWESTGDQWWFASPIDCAAANGHYDLVKKLLHMDPNLLIKLASLRRIRRLETLWDDDEHFDGIANCRSQVAKKLLQDSETKEGQNSLIRSGYGGWLLYTAASAGDLEFVKELINREPMLVFGEGEYGVTDIFYAAAKSKSSEILRLLLDCSVSTKEMMNIAVHAAARGGNVEILRELLGNCFDVLAYRDDHGATVLHSAAGRGQVKVVKSLLMSYGISSSRDKQGNTALHVAAYRGYLAVVELLVATSSSSVLMTNNYGDTLLHMAVAGFTVQGFRRLDRQIELMKQLVSGKIVNIEDIINVRNNEGKTALHMAVMANVQTDLVELLMTAQSVDLNICDAEGNTLLDLLKRQPGTAASEILIRRLISAGAVSSFQDNGTRSGIVSSLRPLCIIGSPGTGFRISDPHLDEMSPCHSVAGSDSYGNKKLPYVNSAARRLKFLLQRAWRKGIGNMEDKNSIESYHQHWSIAEKAIPLRQRFSSMPTLSATRASFSPSISSPSPKSMNQEKSKMKRKSSSFNMRLVNKFFCVGAHGLAMEHPSGSSEPKDHVYKHTVAV